MKRNKSKNQVTPIANPLAPYDPNQPLCIPKEFNKAYKRSVYFPKIKAAILYQIIEMIKESTRVGTKMTFNDLVIEAIEFWYKQNRRKHFSWLLMRLSKDKNSLHSEMTILQKSLQLSMDEIKQIRQSIAHCKTKSVKSYRTLLLQYDKLEEAMQQIEKFLYEHRQIISTSDYETLITEIIHLIKKHSSMEMNRALSKVLTRSDIHELASNVRHKTKIEQKKTVSRKNDDEELEFLYDEQEEK